MWGHPHAGCQLMPTTTMSSASLKFYLLSSLILLCAISWSTGMPTRNCVSDLTKREREVIYSLLPPVSDERNADAEMDIRLDLCKMVGKLKPKRP